MAEKKQYWNFDRLLMRTKDILLIGGLLYGAFAFSARYLHLPGDVEALASSDKRQDEELNSLKGAIRDTGRDIREIKEYLIPTKEIAR